MGGVQPGEKDECKIWKIAGFPLMLVADIQRSDDIAKPQDCGKTVDTCHLLNCSRNSREM